MSGTILFLSAAEVSQTLSMETAIPAVRGAFVQLSRGLADVPVRTHLSLEGDGGALFMPVYLSRMSWLGCKIVTVVPENQDRGLPTTQALMAVFDAETGRAEAVMDAEVLTAVRTGAASGVATDALARVDASVAAIIGAGIQGRRQLEAICCVRAIEQALVYDRERLAAEMFAAEMNDRLHIPVRVLDDPSGGHGADVICTATSSVGPVLADEDGAPGTHINAIGAYRPNTREIPGETVARAHLVVDSREAYLEEAGELVLALDEGLLADDFIPDEIGQVVMGSEPGRKNDLEITLFKSVGNAVQDLAVASVVLDEARRLGLGTGVEL